MNAKHKKISEKNLMEQKTERLNIRITKANKEKLEADAQAQGMTPSSYIPYLVNQRDGTISIIDYGKLQKRIRQIAYDQMQDKEDMRRIFDMTLKAIEDNRNNLSPKNEHILISSLGVLFDSYLHRADKRFDECVDASACLPGCPPLCLTKSADKEDA